MESTELFEPIDRALDLAKRAAPEAEVLVKARRAREANTRFARNEITSNGDVDETTLEVRIAMGQRHASAETNQLDTESLRNLVARAVAMARLAPEDPESMPMLGAQRYATVGAAFDTPTFALDAPARAHAANASIAAATAKGLQGAGFYQHSGWAVALKTSRGLVATHRQTQASLEVTARTADGTGSGWAMGASHKAGDVDAAAVARVATDKAVRSKGPRLLDPGRYTVILEPVAVAELLGFLAGGLDARSADEGRSFFGKPGGGNRVGEKLFADAVTFRSDPTDPATPEAPFDDEGEPLAPTSWIDKGTLASLVYTRYWAKKVGKAPTGDPNVFTLAGGTASGVDDLVRGVPRGLLVTRFWYTRWVDQQSMLITGLTRDGVFLIENGQVVAPVNNFRFNESPITVLRNLDGLTKETTRIPPWRVPALRTHEFNMASRSDAV